MAKKQQIYNYTDFLANPVKCTGKRNSLYIRLTMSLLSIFPFWCQWFFDYFVKMGFCHRGTERTEERRPRGNLLQAQNFKPNTKSRFLPQMTQMGTDAGKYYLLLNGRTKADF
jgi:hypothetical protein